MGIKGNFEEGQPADATAVRQNVFDEDECRALGRILGIDMNLVEAVGLLAWIKTNAAPYTVVMGPDPWKNIHWGSEPRANTR